MTQVYIVKKHGEEWNGVAYEDARQAFDAAKTRATAEDQPINEYEINVVDVTIA